MTTDTKKVGFTPAFTMIELIFVIVILGILAAVALPRLAATRDDAQTVKIANDIMTGAGDIASYAMAQASTESNLSKMSNSIKDLENAGIALLDNNKTAVISYGEVSDCVTIKIYSSSNDENLSILLGNSNSDSKCDALQSIVDVQHYPMKLRGKSVVF